MSMLKNAAAVLCGLKEQREGQGKFKEHGFLLIFDDVLFLHKRMVPNV